MVFIHPDTCSAIMPFYSVSVSVLSLEPPAWQSRVSNVWSLWFPRPGNWPDNFIHSATVMWHNIGEQYPTAPGPRTQLAAEQRNPFQYRTHLDSFHHESSRHYSNQGFKSNITENKHPTDTRQRPGDSFRWAISVVEASMVRSIVQISRWYLFILTPVFKTKSSLFFTTFNEQ